MMLKGSDVVGKPIISQDTGKQIHKVEDVVFDQETNQIVALVVDEGGWISSARVLPWAGVKTIGPDVVIARTKDLVVKAEQVPQIQAVMERGNTLRGMKIVTTDGRDLGVMADVYFDDQTGKVVGYEASGGIFGDAYNGRSFIPAPKTFQIGEDVVFVDPEVADMMEEQTGGIKAAVQQTSEKLQEVTQNASEKLQQAAQSTGEKLQQAGQTATEKVQQTLAATTVEQTKGKRIRREVRGNNGLLIAATGQIVTKSIIEQARTEHKEQQLMDAVGLQSTDAARNTAGDQLKEGASQIKEEASNLVGRIKEGINNAAEQAAKTAEQNRINYALGRPVTRVILDKKDNVILNVGELVTNEAVQKARQAEALDILLSSVYDKTPELTTDDLRAPQAGEASLEQKKQDDQTAKV